MIISTNYINSILWFCVFFFFYHFKIKYELYIIKIYALPMKA